MFLICCYVVDKESGDVLLVWLKLFEDFIYCKVGDWKVLVNYEKLIKFMILKLGMFYGQDLIDKMVLLIKEELYYFYQVLEIMEGYGIIYDIISLSCYVRGLF